MRWGTRNELLFLSARGSPVSISMPLGSLREMDLPAFSNPLLPTERVPCGKMKVADREPRRDKN